MVSGLTCANQTVTFPARKEQHRLLCSKGLGTHLRSKFSLSVAIQVYGCNAEKQHHWGYQLTPHNIPRSVWAHAAFSSTMGAALPQPFGIGEVFSILCNKKRAACLRLKFSRCAFRRLLPKAVTTCSSLLSNGKAAQYTHKGKDASHRAPLNSPLVASEIINLNKAASTATYGQCTMNLKHSTANTFRNSLSALNTQQPVCYPSQQPSQALPEGLFTSW